MASKRGNSKDARLEIIYKKISDIVPYAVNPRKNEATALKLKKSIDEFGFKNPVILDENDVIVAGHARVKAAAMLGMEEVPCVYATGLTEDEIKAYRIADNKTAEIAGWNYDKLCGEMESLAQSAFDLSFTGFDEAEQLFYLEDKASSEEVDEEAYRYKEYMDETEAEALNSYNVAIECSGPEEMQYLAELIKETKRLQRFYHAEVIIDRISV